jgi:hypothetical protein
VSAKLTCDTVEIVVGAFVTVKLTGEILVCAVKLSYPSTFNNLNSVGKNLGTNVSGIFFFNHALFKTEVTLRHLIGGLISGPGKLYCLVEVLGVIIDEADCALSVTKNVLRCVRGITAAKKHCIVILSGNVVGLNERVRAKVSCAVLTKCADYNSGHWEEQRCLIEVIHNAKVFKTAHFRFLLYIKNLD